MCDILVLSDNAKIGLPEITLGLIPGIGGTQKLTRLLGKNLAMKHILTGDPIDISKIKQSGVVDVLVAENFEEEVDLSNLGVQDCPEDRINVDGSHLDSQDGSQCLGGHVPHSRLKVRESHLLPSLLD